MAPPAAPPRMGLFMATMLVTVNMVGTGIFLLPATMASIGTISVLGWLGGAVGAFALGTMFALLGAADPKPGGPYAYARETFGPYTGFQSNYVYWTANLVGNVAVATTVVGYLAELLPALRLPALATGAGLLLIAGAVAANLLGPRFVGALTGWATAIALVPLALIVLVGWRWFDPAVFAAGWNPHGMAPLAAVTTSATFALWAFMGVESASVAAGVIENPRRNIPLATLLGLALATVLYVGTCVVIMGIIPAERLAASAAPFAVAADAILGTAGALAIGLCAILKSAASLVGWTLTIAQSAQVAARDGVFPRAFAGEGEAVPVGNFVVSGVLMGAILVLTASASLNEQFARAVNIAIVLTLLPYLYSSVAFLKAYALDPRRGRAWAAVGVALVATAYCLAAIAGSEPGTVRDATIFLFLSIPLYAAFRRRAYAAARPAATTGGSAPC
jgi:arginine:agmatine antiporter